MVNSYVRVDSIWTVLGHRGPDLRSKLLTLNFSTVMGETNDALNSDADLFQACGHRIFRSKRMSRPELAFRAAFRGGPVVRYEHCSENCSVVSSSSESPMRQRRPVAVALAFSVGLPLALSLERGGKQSATPLWRVGVAVAPTCRFLAGLRRFGLPKGQAADRQKQRSALQIGECSYQAFGRTGTSLCKTRDLTQDLCKQPFRTV